jgi:hypothetical protein
MDGKDGTWEPDEAERERLTSQDPTVRARAQARVARNRDEEAKQMWRLNNELSWMLDTGDPPPDGRGEWPLWPNRQPE